MGRVEGGGRGYVQMRLNVRCDQEGVRCSGISQIPVTTVAPVAPVAPVAALAGSSI